MARVAKPPSVPAVEPPGLTPQQSQVYKLAAEGKTVGEIARALNTSPPTVRSQLAAIRARGADASGYLDCSTDLVLKQVLTLRCSNNWKIPPSAWAGTSMIVRGGSSGRRTAGARSGRVTTRKLTDEERAELEEKTREVADRNRRELLEMAPVVAKAYRAAHGENPNGVKAREYLLAAGATGVYLGKRVVLRERARVMKQLAQASRRMAIVARKQDVELGLTGAPARMAGAVKAFGPDLYAVEREYVEAVLERVLAARIARGDKDLQVVGPVFEWQGGDLPQEGAVEGRVAAVAGDTVLVEQKGAGSVVVKLRKVVFRSRGRVWIAEDPGMLRRGDVIRCRGGTAVVKSWGPFGSPGVLMLAEMSAVRSRKVAA